MKISKDHQTGTGRRPSGTTNHRGTRKPNNTLKITRNPIPRNPDKTLTEIQDLVPNRIRSQWTRGLTVPTKG